MDVTLHVAKFSKMIVFVLIALITSSYPAYCEKSKFDTNEEFTETQYKNRIKEFQRVFGKQIEAEFGLKWIEGGFTHNFSSDDIEFHAYHRATLEKARALELAVLDKLDKAIRSDSKISAYLNSVSLAPESIGVSIGFVDLHNWGYNDGSIDHVYFRYIKKDESAFQRYLLYTTTDPFYDYSVDKDETFSTRYEENLEDAIRLNTAIPFVNPTIQLAKFEDELDQILAIFKKEMKENHGLLFRSIGWMVAGKSTDNITEIRTKCTYLYSVDCEEARVLMLLASEKLLAALNNSETLRPYIKDYPFSTKQLKLRMLFRKEKYFVGDVPYYDESMESAVLSDDMITYYHHIPNAKDSNMHDRVVYAQESYQEVQKTFENTPPPTLFKKTTKGMKNFISSTIHFLDLAVIVFFMFLLLMVTTGGWLLIIPVIIFFILRRRRSPSQED